MKRSTLSLLAAAAIAAVPAAASAQPVLTNFAAPALATGTTLGLSQRKAVGLSLGAQSYTFTSLRADFFSENFGGGGTITGGIYSSVGGNVGTQLAAFNTVSVPAGSAGLIGTFTTASSFTLVGGTSYWFVLLNLVDAGTITNWTASSAAPTTVAGATSLGYRISTDNGATFNTSSVNNRVEINATVVGTAVPEPGTYALVLGGLAALGAAARARRRA